MADYASKNQYMLSADPIEAKVKVLNDYAQNYVVDWFGDNARFLRNNDEIYAYISSTESTIIYWCLQYGENIELLEPLATRTKIKNIIKKMSDMYDR